MFAPGQTSRDFQIWFEDDTLKEQAETVLISLGVPVNARLGEPATAVVTIYDNESPPPVSFQTATSMASENDQQAILPVHLAFASSEPVSVEVASGGGSATPGHDYVALTKKLIFPPGKLSQNVVLPLLDDGLIEGQETVLLKLSAPSGATLGSYPVLSLSIVDDDRIWRLYLPLAVRALD